MALPTATERPTVSSRLLVAPHMTGRQAVFVEYGLPHCEVCSVGARYDPQMPDTKKICLLILTRNIKHKKHPSSSYTNLKKREK